MQAEHSMPYGNVRTSRMILGIPRVVIGNNSVMTTFNVIKVAETSTEIIDMHGDYVEGRQVIHTKWTQKGREFLYNFLKDIGVVPLIEKEVC